MQNPMKAKAKAKGKPKGNPFGSKDETLVIKKKGK